MFRGVEICVLVVIALIPPPALALCRSYIEDRVAAPLRYSFVCENTYAAPRYTIIRQYIGDKELAFFEFAPKEIALICSSGSFSGRDFADCHSFIPGDLPDFFDGGIGPVHLHPWSDTSELAFALEKSSRFRFPEDLALVGDIGCAVNVSENRALDLFFLAENPGSLAECLLRFEIFATQNWKNLIVK